MASHILVREKVQTAPGQPPERARRRRGQRWILGACGLLVVALLAITWAARVRQQAAAPGAGGPAAFVAATRGSLTRSVRVGGILAAVHFASIMAPALRSYGDRGRSSSGMSLTVMKIAQPGTRVKKDDVLVEFDRQYQINDYEDLQADIAGLQDGIAKAKADIEVQREQRKTELQRAINAVEAARWENQRNEVLSKIDAEKNQQTLKEAEANLSMLRQTQKLRDEAADANLKLLEINLERQRVFMERARMNFERMIVHSPIDGLVVAVPFFKAGSMGTVQEGDQVRPGMPFMQVVDSSEMVVRARVNQVDAALLHPEGPVQIRLDAYPDIVLSGRVQTVGTVAQATGSRGSTGAVKSFAAVLSVDGTDPRLIPDISASVDVIIEQAPEAVLVPRGAVVRQAASREAGFVWVKQGDSVQPRAVTLGPRNDTHWAIAGGLKEGELVALAPPAGALKPSAPPPQQTDSRPAASGLRSQVSGLPPTRVHAAN